MDNLFGDEIYHLLRNALMVSTILGFVVGFIWKWFMKPSIFKKVDLKMKAFAESQVTLNDKAYADKEKYIKLENDVKHMNADLNEWKDVVKDIKK